MKTPESAEYQNFKNLLRRIVSVPHAEIQKRMEDERATKDWTRENDQPEHRNRPIVSPGSGASSKNHSSRDES
jgi:hypothetical protein